MSVTEFSSLPGVRVYDLKVNLDDRGYFVEAFRDDWKSFIEEDKIVQINTNYSYPDVVRAWHRHERGQIDYFLTLQGSLKICAYDDREGPTKGHLVEIITSSQRLQLVRIPGHYWHGSKTLGTTPSMLVYYVTKLYDYKTPDEERRPWNDPLIIDPKTQQPFDWNRCQNK